MNTSRGGKRDDIDDFEELHQITRFAQSDLSQMIKAARNLSEDSEVEERQFVVDHISDESRKLIVTGFSFVHTFMMRLPSQQWKAQLSKWPVRKNGSQLIPGQHKTFFRRIINGADIKNQTQSALAASAICHYLNIFQLLQMWFVQQVHGDWTKSPNKVVSAFAKNVEDCIFDKIVSWLMLERTVGNVQLQDTFFTSSERKHIGHRLIRILGCLERIKEKNQKVHFDPDNTTWYLFLNQNDDSQTITRETIKDREVDDPVGLFVELPLLRCSLKRSDTPVMAIVTLHGSPTSSKAFFSILRSDDGGSLKPFVTAAMKYRDAKFVQKDKRICTNDILEEKPPRSGGDEELDQISSSEGHDEFIPLSTHRAPPVTIEANAKDIVEKMTADEDFDDEENAMYEAAKNAQDIMDMSEDCVMNTSSMKDITFNNIESSTNDDTTLTVPSELHADDNEGFWGEDGFFYYYDVDTGEYYAVDTGEEEEGGNTNEEYCLYWDPYWEVYIWYGMQVDYDTENDWFYTYNPETGEYHWLDEESNTAMLSGNVPVWDYDINYEGEAQGASDEIPEGYYLAEDGYCYPNDEWDEGDEATEEQGESAIDGAPEIKFLDTPESTTPSTSASEMMSTPTPASVAVPTKTAQLKAMWNANVQKKQIEKQGEKGGLKYKSRSKGEFKRSGAVHIEALKASEQMLLSRAVTALAEDMQNSFGEEGYSQCIGHWKEMRNSSYIGKSKRLVVGLMCGDLELKSLPSINLTEISAILQHMNLVQITLIRISAQNTAWDRAPHSGMKVFALKADSMIYEKTLNYVFYKGWCMENPKYKLSDLATSGLECVEEDGDLKIFKGLTGRERQYMGQQIVFLYGASTLWKDSDEQSKGSYWFVKRRPDTNVPYTSPKDLESLDGAFIHVPSMTLTWKVPPSDSQIYRLSTGASYIGYMLWEISKMPNRCTADK